MSCCVVLRRVVPRHLMLLTRVVDSCHVTVVRLLTSLVRLCRVMSRHVASCPVMPVMSCHLMSSHVMSRLVISCRVMSYRVPLVRGFASLESR